MSQPIESGLLLFDDDAKRSLLEKIGRGSIRHLEKLGVPPSICVVNAAQFDAAKLDAAGGGWARGYYDVIAVKGVGDVRVVASKSTLVNHFWLGVPEKTPEPAKDNFDGLSP